MRVGGSLGVARFSVLEPSTAAEKTGGESRDEVSAPSSGTEVLAGPQGQGEGGGGAAAVATKRPRPLPRFRQGRELQRQRPPLPRAPKVQQLDPHGGARVLAQGALKLPRQRLGPSGELPSSRVPTYCRRATADRGLSFHAPRPSGVLQVLPGGGGGCHRREPGPSERGLQPHGPPRDGGRAGTGLAARRPKCAPTTVVVLRTTLAES